MQLQEIKVLFDKFDQDKSGTLELEELNIMFETAGLLLNASHLKRMFRQGTGENKRIETLTLE
jgi:Ca2+-binding EF-hand superfamily protein